MPKGNLAPGATTISELLRAPSGRIELGTLDPRATPGFKGKKADGQAALAAHQTRLEELQEQLYAQGRSGGMRSLLLVLQGLDTSGKGGTVRHVVGAMDPGGVHAASFGKPTPEELKHDFLWRIRAQLPRPGKVGVFDRSHYEDVVTVRVLNLVDKATSSRRFGTINRFEQRLADGGMEIVKCYLHISAEERRAAAARPARRSDEAVEVQPGRPRHARALAGSTSPPTSTRWRAARPRPRSGTSSPRTGNRTELGGLVAPDRAARGRSNRPKPGYNVKAERTS